jgi:hypothetical protein
MSNIKKIFFEEGFITKQKILSNDEADEINIDYENFLSKKNSWVDLTEHKSKTHLFFPWANKLIRNEKILNLASQILGENFYCWNSLIFYKKPNSKQFVSMHQDQNYWGIIHDKALSIQIAISNSHEKNGCLKIIPKSHAKNYKHKDFFNLNNILARGQSISSNEINKDELINIDLNKGECCMFHGNIVHGSYENYSDDPRFLFTMRFVTTDNKIQSKYYYNSATLVRGDDKFNYFDKENTIQNSSIKKLRLLHKKTLIDQFKKYLDIKFKIKFISNFLMLFLKIDIIRGLFYKIIKKV